LTNELASYRKTDFTVGYGQISLVNQKNRTVWLNLGRADELRSGVTFNVKAANQGTSSGDSVKARIEVTEILGPHLSEARILEDNLIHPLVPGDQVYTSLWHPGMQEHYAIVGQIDLDKDGNDDRDTIRDLITQAGGVVDAEADGEKRVGAMTVNTRFVIVGTPPKEKGQAAYSDLLSEADKLKIDRISVEKIPGPLRMERSSAGRSLWSLWQCSKDGRPASRWRRSLLEDGCERLCEARIPEAPATVLYDAGRQTGERLLI